MSVEQDAAEAVEIELAVRKVRPVPMTGPEAMGLEEALLQFGRLVLVGDPGAGKSTMLRQLGERLAQAEVTVPVRVSLADYVDSGVPGLAEFASGDGGGSGGRPDTGRVALLLDGLDEVLASGGVDDPPEAYRRVVDEIGHVAADHPHWQVVVACRRAAWRGGLPGFQVIEVCDLDRSQAATFVRGRFGGDPARVHRVLSVLMTSDRLQSLVGSPLILSLLADELAGGVRAPSRRTALYDRIAETLLGQWNPGRGAGPSLSAGGKRDVLAAVAWHLHRSRARECPLEDLLPVVAATLATVGVAPGRVAAVVNEIAIQHGVLKPYPDGRFGFAQLALQEYFTAFAAAARGAQAVRHLVRHRHDPWWREVLLLFAGLAADASPLLLGILGRESEAGAPRAPLAADDDVLHQDLLLAASCLGAQPRVRLGWLPAAIVEATHEVMRAGPSRRIRESAAQALATVDERPLFERLIGDLTDASIDEVTRWHIAEALGETGDAHVADLLTAVLDRLDPRDHMAGQVALALLALRHTSAVPALRARLAQQWETGRLDAFVAGAVAGLGGAAGTAQLRQISKAAGRQGSEGWKLAWALKFSAEPAVPDWLIASIRKCPEQDLFSYVESYLALRGTAGAPRLLAALLTRASWGVHFDDVASRFHEYASPALVDPLLDALTDKRRQPPIRWAVSAILDHIPQSWPAQRALVTAPDADRLTVYATAAVLGRQGQKAAQQPLREALTALTTRRSEAARRFALPRVAEALAALGDDQWAQQTLLPHIEAALASNGPLHRADTIPLLLALARTDVQRIPDTATEIVDRLLTKDWFALFDNPDLAALALPAAVPHLLDHVEAGRFGTYETQTILRLVATAARDLSAISRLLPLLSAQEGRIREHALDALTTIGQHNQVRIFANHRVAPMTPPPDGSAPPARSADDRQERGEDLAGLLDDQVAFYGAVAAEYDDHALLFPGGAELSEALDAFHRNASRPSGRWWPTA